MKKLFLFTLFLFCSPMCGAEGESQAAGATALEDPSYERTFALPVNWSTTPKYAMVVTIPRGFKSLQPVSSLASSADSLEFIPEKDDEKNWTEIITIFKYVGKNISAIKFIADFKKSMLDKVKDGKVWFESNTTKPSYEQSTLGLLYNLENKHEVMGALYYSGPYDCSGVQYTIRPKPGQSDDDATKVIENFFKTNTEIISLSPS